MEFMEDSKRQMVHVGMELSSLSVLVLLPHRRLVTAPPTQYYLAQLWHSSSEIGPGRRFLLGMNRQTASHSRHQRVPTAVMVWPFKQLEWGQRLGEVRVHGRWISRG